MREAIPASRAGVGIAEFDRPFRDFTTFKNQLDVKRLIAIIHPENGPSQRVAEKIGLAHERDAISGSGEPVRIYATAL